MDSTNGRDIGFNEANFDLDRGGSDLKRDEKEPTTAETEEEPAKTVSLTKGGVVYNVLEAEDFKNHADVHGNSVRETTRTACAYGSLPKIFVADEHKKNGGMVDYTAKDDDGE
ncbi:hypothetical protein FZEAL_4653 [Fusarium zealandicum]|uniref:Uncharacterized protein n=1 Tax=Fusarium zealandicum TaxID=1053134 RepID=A0A8H4ULC7_9HYPO|nr:hypothetical protein FZEAL_4653 [Fusarium zealandicum]